MPFHGHFQSPNALLVESSNFTVQTGSAYSANPGDVVIHATNSTGGPATATITITLPPVTQAGPVTVIQTATVGTATIKSFETSGVFIAGTAGTTGVTMATVTETTFASDGSNWWKVIG